ncbi:uncharacterized protein LOC116348377 [Contarinia nasturtii]|uniref:uncharacterized protein LOC116348377 n=1 Tax=Contarinia nasturtii TaxID=265458 RepID=UPI0012D4AF0A|nr:uncharacterized protein LOC116348377 [Contarinia nasturtii]
MEHKALTIGIFALSLVISLFIGISIAALLAIWCPRKIRKTPDSMKIDMFPNEKEMEAVKRMGLDEDIAFRRRFASQRLKRPTIQMAMHASVFENFEDNRENESDEVVSPPVPPRGNSPPPVPPRDSTDAS